MSVSTEKSGPAMLAQPGSSRPVQELTVTLVFAPVANAIVRILAPTRLSPPAVVVAHGLVGFAAAVLLGAEALAAAAVLLQLRTLLDNVDGRLARATGRVTLAGRYLDTAVDLVVNVAVFAALALVTGRAWLALAGFVSLTVILAVDFNVSRLYSEARGEVVPSAPPTGGALERGLARIYRAVFGPQDRLVGSFATGRLARILDGERDPARRARAQLAYHDRLTVSILANLGLSTQLVVLGVCLVLDAPSAYLWLLLAFLASLPALQLRRERLARRALAV